MSRTDKIIPAIFLAFVLLLLGYGTFQMFRGNFGFSMATFPLLAIAYLFIMARRG
jgi:hypothetical protein